ncbi:MAG: glycosyltransferase, partial [Verrucomicrobiota bacterium]
FTFVFAGGAVVRKGVDIILKAYEKAFSAEDDVCLVIKDHSGDAIYEKSELRDEIKAFRDDPTKPALIYIDEFLPEETLASLFRSFDVGVFPYRAEGFCVPILETMACGTPSLVPNLGPCVDFCDEDTSYLMPTLRINLPVNREMDLNLGFVEHIDEVDFCEVRVETLANFMREVYEAPAAELEEKSRRGIERAHAQFTWDRSAARVFELLGELDEPVIPRRMVSSRNEEAAQEKRKEMARQLLSQSG